MEWKTNQNIQPRAHKGKKNEKHRKLYNRHMGPRERDNMLGRLGAQLVNHPTLDPGSGHDIKPCVVLCTQLGI